MMRYSCHSSDAVHLSVFPPRLGDVRMPSGKVAKPDIADNKDGTVTVKYAPVEAGLHEMDIKYDGIHIPGKTWSSPSNRDKRLERNVLL